MNNIGPGYFFIQYLKNRREHPEEYKEINLPWWVLLLILIGLIVGITVVLK